MVNPGWFAHSGEKFWRKMQCLGFIAVFLDLVRHFFPKVAKTLLNTDEWEILKKNPKNPRPQTPQTWSKWAQFSFTEKLWELFFFIKKKFSLECKFWFWLSVTACFEVFQTKINISITERIIVVLFRIIWLRVTSNLRINKVLRPQRLWKSLTLFCFVNFL